MKSNLTPHDKGQVGVYLLQNPQTLETYVGSGILSTRCYRHERDLKNGTHPNHRLQRAYRQSPNFEFVGVAVEDRETALQVEQRLIDEHKDNPLFLNIELNVRNTQHGIQKQEQTKEKMRASALRRWQDPAAKMEVSQTWQAKKAQGFKRTPESLAPSIEARQKAVSAEGVFYPSQAAAAQAHGISQCTVRQRIASPHFPTWLNVEGAPHE